MKNKGKVIISSLILGSLILGIGIRNTRVPDPLQPNVENVEITEKKKVRIKSEEELKLIKNVEAYKENELLTLENRYKDELSKINYESSGINTKAYSEVEFDRLKAEYFSKTGENGTLTDFRILEAAQEYDNNVESVEEYSKNMLVSAVLLNKTPITVQDDALKRAITDELELETGDIYFKDMIKLKHLDLNGATLSSLDGLEYAINLENLDLGNLNTENLKMYEPLKLLQSLKTINFLGTFNYYDFIPLDYLAESVEYVGLEDFELGAEYNFKIINETENTETTGGI